MIKTGSLRDKEIIEDNLDEIEAVKMRNDYLRNKIQRKEFPFSFIDDTGLSLYGLNVKNKCEVQSYHYEKDCFYCVVTCGLTYKRRKEYISEDQLMLMISS